MSETEGAGLDEMQILKPYQAHYKQVKETFSREDTLKKAPDEMKKLFEELFHTIDETELLINFYEIQNGKRTKPPRTDLINKFSEEEQRQLKLKANGLSQYQFLKKKHELVERRKEQYTLRDSFETKIKKSYSAPGMPIADDEVLTFDCDAPVLPLGLYTDQTSQKLIFQPLKKLNPAAFNEEELKLISNVYWDRKENKGKIYFDFREMEHVYQLFLQYFELKDCYLNDDVNSTTNYLFRTLEYYLSLTILPDVYKDVLEMKIKKFKNDDIAAFVNKKHGKTYTANYISTIFRQKIIKQINESARRHETIIENLFFEENFKKCNTCGEWYLICAENFVRKATSPDGFTNRCKNCDKEKRLKKKGVQNG